MNHNLLQSQINRLEAQLRKKYITLKNQTVKNIAAQYSGAYAYIGDVVASSKNALDTSNLDDLYGEVNDAFDHTHSFIEQSFNSNLLGLDLTSAQGVLEILGLAALIPTSIQDQIIQTARQTTDDLFTVPAFLDGLTLSDRIWSVDNKVDLIKLITNGIQEGLNPHQIASDIEQYSLTGDGYYNAHRLAFTESTRSYSTTKVDSLRDWNDNPDAQFQVAIEQSVSPWHDHEDICDELAGIYNLDEDIPMIPRHPLCEDIQRTIIIGQDTSFVDFNPDDFEEDIPTY